MTERGAFAIDRAIWDHPLFAREAFTECQAWIWIISAAAWKPTKLRVGRGVFDLQRGQLAFSERFLAERWRWSRSRVNRFLCRLEIESMVTLKSDHYATQITICNYDDYQFGRTTDEAATEPPTGPLASHQRTKEEELKEPKKEEKKDIRAIAVATRPLVADPFDEFWKAYPRRDGANPKAPAKKLFIAAMKGGAEAASIIEGARRCCNTEHEKIGTPYIPQAVKWLRDRRWEDYAAGPPGAADDLSDDQRRKMFEQLRGPNERAEGKDLRQSGDGPRAIEGPRREEPAHAADDKTRHSGMVSLGELFPRTSRF